MPLRFPEYLSLGESHKVWLHPVVQDVLLYVHTALHQLVQASWIPRKEGYLDSFFYIFNLLNLHADAPLPGLVRYYEQLGLEEYGCYDNDINLLDLEAHIPLLDCSGITKLLGLEEYTLDYNCIVDMLDLTLTSLSLDWSGINELPGLEGCLTDYNKDVDMHTLKADLPLWSA